MSAPSFNVSLEGAGRTEFYFLEQEIAVNRRRASLRRADKSAMAAAAAAAKHEAVQIEARVLDAFFQLVHAQERIRTMSTGIDALQEAMLVVPSSHSDDKVAALDAFLAAQVLAELAVARAESEIEVVESRASLAEFLGERVDAETLHAIGTLAQLHEQPSLADALAEALSSRPDFLAAEARLEQLRHEAISTRRRAISNPRVQAGVKRADVGGHFAVGPFVAVSIPLDIASQWRSRNPPGGPEEDSRREQLGIIRNRILAEVREAHHTLRIRRRAVDEYRTHAIGTGYRPRQDAWDAFRSGGIDRLGLLRSLRAALDSELRILDLQQLAKSAEIGFLRATARPML